MPDSNQDLYATVVEVRNVELGALWTRFNIHLLINGAYLLAVITVHDAGALIVQTKAAPYVFGLLLVLLWFASEWAGRCSLHYRDRKIKEFEKTFWTNKSLKDYKFFRDSPSYLRIQSYVSRCVVGVFAFAWMFLLGYTLCR